MTISKYLRSKKRKAQIIGFLSWLVFGVALFIPCDCSKLLYVMIPFFGFGASIVYVLFFIVCPKCTIRLGQIEMGSNKKPKLNYCPNCGMSLVKKFNKSSSGILRTRISLGLG